jgi:uncharacterized membrane protein
MDTKTRSIIKTISWRITGTLCTFLISWAILGDIKTSSAIAIIQLTFNSIVFYFHERLWNIVKWGQDEH